MKYKDVPNGSKFIDRDGLWIKIQGAKVRCIKARFRKSGDIYYLVGAPRTFDVELVEDPVSAEDHKKTLMEKYYGRQT